MRHFYHKIDGFATEVEQGELLVTLLGNVPDDRELKIAEIGVYKGRGTAMWNIILMNENLSYDYQAIDHFLGSSEHEPGVDYYGEALKNLAPIADRISLIRSDSVTQSKKYPDQHFDIVYIDAAHEYEHVKEDIVHWLPKVKPGGILCGDDYIDGWPGVVKAVNEIFGNEINVAGNQQWWIKK